MAEDVVDWFNKLVSRVCSRRLQVFSSTAAPATPRMRFAIDAVLSSLRSSLKAFDETASNKTVN
jgi:hypothetical protein